MGKFILVVPTSDEDLLKVHKTYLDFLDKFNLKYLISSYNLNTLDDIDSFGAVLLIGGGDFSQNYLGERLHPLANGICEKRDLFELRLAKLAYEKKIATLGICRGAQAMNLALGGSISQHIEGHMQSQPKDVFSHFVNIEKDSKLKSILKKEKINVNSFHHQVIEDVSKNLVCCAKSDDGYIEAIEAKDDFFFVGVQWHPEKLHTEESAALFKEFSKNIKL